jgi:hypothetical protein
MTLDADEFIRRLLIHVLPDGFHRIGHYGLFANANRAPISHWPASSSVQPTEPRQRIRAMALRVVKTMKSGTLVLTEAGAYDHRRDPLNPAASHSFGPSQRSASTARDQRVPVTIAH